MGFGGELVEVKFEMFFKESGVCQANIAGWVGKEGDLDRGYVGDRVVVGFRMIQ